MRGYFPSSLFWPDHPCLSIFRCFLHTHLCREGSTIAGTLSSKGSSKRHRVLLSLCHTSTSEIGLNKLTTA